MGTWLCSLEFWGETISLKAGCSLSKGSNGLGMMMVPPISISMSEKESLPTVLLTGKHVAEGCW